MIRFGKILPLWNFLRVLDNFVLSNGAFGKILNILWKIFHAIGKINIFDNSSKFYINLSTATSNCFAQLCLNSVNASVTLLSKN